MSHEGAPLPLSLKTVMEAIRTFIKNIVENLQQLRGHHVVQLMSGIYNLICPPQKDWHFLF